MVLHTAPSKTYLDHLSSFSYLIYFIHPNFLLLAAGDAILACLSSSSHLAFATPPSHRGYQSPSDATSSRRSSGINLTLVIRCVPHCLIFIFRLTLH